MTTHDMCSRPPNSPTMVGSAVATMIWSNAARKVTNNRQTKIHRSCFAAARSVACTSGADELPITFEFTIASAGGCAVFAHDGGGRRGAGLQDPTDEPESAPSSQLL